jgi:hypothetical protein
MEPPSAASKLSPPSYSSYSSSVGGPLCIYGVIKVVAAVCGCLQELVECPLCIEPLDATDRDFWPCSCG